MKLLHKKNLKEENYIFFQATDENIVNPFKPNASTTIFQIIIWIIIGFVIIVLLKKLYIN